MCEIINKLIRILKCLIGNHDWLIFKLGNLQSSDFTYITCIKCKQTKIIIESKGYRQTPSPFIQKEIKEETNEKSPSFFIKYYEITFNGYYSERIEVELVSAYSFSVDEFKENIDYIENKLANIWRSLYVADYR
jgi:hypothetical protein